MEATRSKILCELRKDGQLLHVTLNAPEGNVIDTGMLQGLDVVLGAHGRTQGLKAIIFEGAGDHFSYGTSVSEHRKDKVEALMTRFRRVLLRLLQLAVPTIAVVRGHCLSGGFELAAYCNWIFAAPDARFSQPEIKIGVFPPVGSVLLPWRLGGGAGLDLCLSGRSFDAEEALGMGLIKKIGDDPSADAYAFFERYLAPRSASSLHYAELASRATLRPLLEETLPDLERLYLEELMSTHDAREGIIASMTGREPRYRDR